MSDSDEPDRKNGPQEKAAKKDALGTYQGPSHAAPYALSRMAPSFSLVDAASEIEKADQIIRTMTTGKLDLIAKQMRALREEAERVLENAKRDAELHRVKCSFEKQPGGVYHLYRRANGELYFSIMAPHEWSTRPAQEHVGSYRMETDRSFTAVEDIEAQAHKAKP